MKKWRCLTFVFVAFAAAMLCCCNKFFALNTVCVAAQPAAELEHVEFNFNGRTFCYNLADNIKDSSQFDLNFELNKFNRFGTKQQRQQLLNKMLKIGLDKEVAVNYIFPHINTLVSKVQKNIYVAPRDAKLAFNAGSEKVFSITPEVVGRKVDTSALYNALIFKFLNNKKLVLDVPTITLQPQVFASSFKKFVNLRADFSTSIASSSADRKHNIKNALNSINNVVILPGEVFSFNKTVGRRTAANGYREAKIIVNNEFVDGMGGGVCQVSSTLYNAALLAGLKIEEANKHSKQVNYVKYGFDAMVNFGSSDLKIKNNTTQKITIVATCTGQKARIRIFGQEMQETYKLTNEIVSVTEPQEEVIVDTANEFSQVVFEDESFYLKKPQKGMEVKSYREKYVNGILTQKELLRFDKFKVQNAVKVFGAKKREQQCSLKAANNLLKWALA